MQVMAVQPVGLAAEVAAVAQTQLLRLAEPEEAVKYVLYILLHLAVVDQYIAEEPLLQS
jgi:hypothetical protein